MYERATIGELGSHPDEMMLAAYQSGTLDREERETVGRHLLQCDECMGMLCAVAEAEYALLPASAYADGSEAGLGATVLTFLTHTVEVLRGLSDLTLMPSCEPVAVRSRRIFVPNVVRFHKRFDEGYSAEVEVERLGLGMAEFRFRVYHEGEAPGECRISAVKGNRELSSVLTEGGVGMLDEMPFGRYDLRFSLRGRLIGEILMEVRDG